MCQKRCETMRISGMCEHRQFVLSVEATRYCLACQGVRELLQNRTSRTLEERAKAGSVSLARTTGIAPGRPTVHAPGSDVRMSFKSALTRPGWLGVAARVAPPVVEALSLAWARHLQARTRRESRFHASRIEALNQGLQDKDAEIARLENALSVCGDELAQARETMQTLRRELEAERRRPWWEKLLGRRRPV